MNVKAAVLASQRPLQEYLHLQIPEKTLYYLLTKYRLSHEQMFQNGYPLGYINQPYAYVYSTSFFREVHEKLLLPVKGRQELPEPQLYRKFNKFRRTFESLIDHEYISMGYFIRQCERCKELFAMNLTYQYLTSDPCSFHSGKLENQHYTCCYGRRYSPGCESAVLHVWTGYDHGLNGPLSGYVRSRPMAMMPSGHFGVYALDCEMCYTNEGLELTKVTVITASGKNIYETIVRPRGFIVDLNTRYSGITATDYGIYKHVKSLQEVQTDLLSFIGERTLLIGHGLENDLKALKIIHENVIDTSIMFPHHKGLPYRHSLKALTKHILKREIQCSATQGHDSFEDARAAMELSLWRVRSDIINNYLY